MSELCYLEDPFICSELNGWNPALYTYTAKQKGYFNIATVIPVAASLMYSFAHVHTVQ